MSSAHTQNTTPPASEPEQSDSMMLWLLVVLGAGMIAIISGLFFIISLADVPDETGVALNDAKFVAMHCGDKIGPYAIHRRVGWLGTDEISVSINGMTVLTNYHVQDRDENRRGYWLEDGPWKTSLGPMFAKQRETCMASIEANKVAAREQAALYDRSVRTDAGGHK